MGRGTLFPIRFPAWFLPLLLHPCTRLSQGFGSRQDVPFIEEARMLPLPVLVLVAPLECDAVRHPALFQLAGPHRDLHPPVTSLVDRRVSPRAWLRTLLGCRQPRILSR